MRQTYLAMEHPIGTVADFQPDQLCRGRGNGLVLCGAGAAVAGKNIDIVFGNAKPAGNFRFGNALLGRMILFNRSFSVMSGDPPSWWFGS